MSKKKQRKILLVVLCVLVMTIEGKDKNDKDFVISKHVRLYVSFLVIDIFSCIENFHWVISNTKPAILV
jgi:hypothetical protein